MKKLTTLSILFISFVFVAPIQVSAATNAGAKPGSFFYFFDTASEKINLFFTFNPEKKAQKALEYADERLAEAEESANENNSSAVEKAMTGYKKEISRATEKSKGLKDEERAKALLNIVSENTAKHQEVLASVLEKVPEEARQAILNAIEVSKKGQEEAIKQIAELKSEIERLKNEVESLKKESKNPQADEVEKLKKEVEELKKKQGTNQPIPKQLAPTVQNSQEQQVLEEKPKTSIITLPSGAVVEMDTNGNIVRIVVEAQSPIYTPPQYTSPTQPSVAVPRSDLTVLQANLDSIGNNSYLSYSSKKGRQEIAIQDWMKQNVSDFSIPSYVTQFNVLVTSYGFFYLAQ